MKISQQDNKENVGCQKDNFQRHIKYRDALYFVILYGGIIDFCFTLFCATNTTHFIK